jgi:hypothetical protein
MQRRLGATTRGLGGVIPASFNVEDVHTIHTIESPSDVDVAAIQEFSEHAKR